MILLAESSKFDNPIVVVAAFTTLGIAAVALVLIVTLAIVGAVRKRRSR